MLREEADPEMEVKKYHKITFRPVKAIKKSQPWVKFVRTKPDMLIAAMRYSSCSSN